MRAWTLALVVGAVAAGCGRESSADRPGGTAPQGPELSLAASALTCNHDSRDKVTELQVVATPDASGTYDHAVLRWVAAGATPVTLGDYTSPQDRTPAPPTDIRFRLVFGDDQYTVTLMAGGFTDQATSEVKRAEDGVVLADLTCRQGG